MKATELMIGDKVRIISTKEVIVVEGIGRGAIEYDSGYSVNLDEVEPIPLTEEILEANGWNYVEENFRFYWNGLGLPDLAQITKGQYGFGICNIKYVHGLQHALRLCGVSELADNFKLEKS